jgi:hypothetical protein
MLSAGLALSQISLQEPTEDVVVDSEVVDGDVDFV